MRNKGDVTGSVFYMDEVFMPAAQESLRGPHANTIRRHGAELLMPSMISTVRQIRRSCLDEMGLATLFRLVFTRYEKDFFPNLHTHQVLVNDILHDFHRHCKRERQEYSAEMDKITSLLHHFHQTFLMWLEVFTIADLCDDCSEQDTTTDLVNFLAAYRRRKGIDRALQESNIGVQ
ncbi:hypothetical protein AAVH_28535 [Aphelenchoides avenae]|nr:hypothetical protein AAVH_28535 [Aphelenchus avenae]